MLKTLSTAILGFKLLRLRAEHSRLRAEHSRLRAERSRSPSQGEIMMAVSIGEIMMAVSVKTYTAEEYLELEIASPNRNKYHNGEITPMTGGTPTHNEIIGV